MPFAYWAATQRDNYLKNRYYTYMDTLRKVWKRAPSPIRKPLVAILGILVIITGIILMPLPGPGTVIVIIGISILATEFSWAQRAYERILSWLQAALHWIKKKIKRLRKK